MADDAVIGQFAVLFIVDAAGITAGPGCDQVDATTVRCGAPGQVTNVVANLGDGTDRLEVLNSLHAVVDGGSGSDTITTAGGNDRITVRDGAPGDVVQSCGAGFDVVRADAGDTVASNCELRSPF
ncbi:hypothetical protein [Streptomyces sp. NPDC051211]|uniref:hypothetical protein n=1 Tax=Streptomyces sp. NPDC051211 TaxID=3154643 RepID=UPI00344EDCFE